MFNARFAKITGRSYAYGSTAAYPPAQPDAGVRGPQATRGQALDYATVPASTRHLDRSRQAVGDDRGYMGRTEDALNTGPIPTRIPRQTNALNAGKLGRGMGGSPYDGNALFMPHRMIPRKPMTVTPFARTIDTSVTISASPIGGPIR